MYQEPIFQLDEKEFEQNMKWSLQDDNDINLAEYDVFYLGKYDEQTGKMEMLDNPKHLYNCSKYRNKKIEEAV